MSVGTRNRRARRGQDVVDVQRVADNRRGLCGRHPPSRARVHAIAEGREARQEVRADHVQPRIGIPLRHHLRRIDRAADAVRVGRQQSKVHEADGTCPPAC